MCFLCKNKCLTPEVLFMLCKKASELLYWYGSKQPIYLEFPLVFLDEAQNGVLNIGHPKFDLMVDCQFSSGGRFYAGENQKRKTGQTTGPPMLTTYCGRCLTNITTEESTMWPCPMWVLNPYSMSQTMRGKCFSQAALTQSPVKLK